MNVKIGEKTLEKILPGWIIYKRCECGSEGFDLISRSPAGETFIVALYGKTLSELVSDAESNYDEFDAHAHACDIYLAKINGTEDQRKLYKNLPESLADLIEDASAIDNMYYDVLCALRKEMDSRRRKTR